jgi:hypothetical protein
LTRAAESKPRANTRTEAGVRRGAHRPRGPRRVRPRDPGFKDRASGARGRSGRLRGPSSRRGPQADGRSIRGSRTVSPTGFRHAVVAGGSMAGLLAARPRGPPSKVSRSSATGCRTGRRLQSILFATLVRRVQIEHRWGAARSSRYWHARGICWGVCGSQARSRTSAPSSRTRRIVPGSRPSTVGSLPSGACWT